MTSLFSKIIAEEIPSKKVFEDENIVAFKDIAPLAPVHILIVPKKEIPGLQDIEGKDYFLIGEIIKAAQKIAKELKIADGYRLVTNNGASAGQTVFHLHFHLIGGKKLGPIS